MKTMILILMLLLTVACGREPWSSEPEFELSCGERGGEFVFLPGNPDCWFSGYVCFERDGSRLYVNETEIDPSSCVYKQNF